MNSSRWQKQNNTLIYTVVSLWFVPFVWGGRYISSTDFAYRWVAIVAITIIFFAGTVLIFNYLRQRGTSMARPLRMNLAEADFVLRTAFKAENIIFDRLQEHEETTYEFPKQKSIKLIITPYDPINGAPELPSLMPLETLATLKGLTASNEEFVSTLTNSIDAVILQKKMAESESAA